MNPDSRDKARITAAYARIGAERRNAAALDSLRDVVAARCAADVAAFWLRDHPGQTEDDYRAVCGIPTLEEATALPAELRAQLEAAEDARTATEKIYDVHSPLWRATFGDDE